MASLGEAILEAAIETRLEGASEGGDIEDVRDVLRPDGLEELDRRLATLCREHGPLRAVLARIAARLVDVRAWERLGYARLSDYAAERLGLSARSVQSLAQVGARLPRWPRLEAALVSGRLGWTRVRLLAGLPREEDEAWWIAQAERSTAEQLSKRVRAVDRGSVEAGAIDGAAGSPSRIFEVRCRPDVRWKWAGARGAASRAAGRMLPLAEAAELIAAEVLSSLPIDETADEEDGCEETGASSSDTIGGAIGEERSWLESRAAAVPALGRVAGELQLLLDGLDEADAFGLDDRLQRALAREQRLEARLGPLLARVWERGVHRALGYTTREAYARERLGMDPTRARALVRLERAAAESPPLARAWRTGRLSWVKAATLVPLVSADPLGRFVPEWVAWAGRVTVRRLREDVDRALTVAEAEPAAFRRDGALPPEARGGHGARTTGARAARTEGELDREIRAEHRDSEGDTVGLAKARLGSEGARDDREIRAEHRDSGGDTPGGAEARGASERDRDDRENGAEHREPAARPVEAPAGGPDGMSRDDETCSVRFIGPAEVVRLFRSVLCSVRRRVERDTGRLPTPGEALGAMLDHALASWDVQGGKVAARHKVLARDGWRCAVPGCSSMQNLHDHHIRFRSAGGSDALENRVALCAFHHLRGVHAGRLRCTGRAPGGLTWQLGIRPAVKPLLSYRSGDIREDLSACASSS